MAIADSIEITDGVGIDILPVTIIKPPVALLSQLPQQMLLLLLPIKVFTLHQSVQMLQHQQPHLVFIIIQLLEN